MFCGKTENKFINKIHKHTLQLIYDIEDVIFEDLLERDKLYTIHEDNIHTHYLSKFTDQYTALAHQ